MFYSDGYAVNKYQIWDIYKPVCHEWMCTSGGSEYLKVLRKLWFYGAPSTVTSNPDTGVACYRHWGWNVTIQKYLTYFIASHLSDLNHKMYIKHDALLFSILFLMMEIKPNYNFLIKLNGVCIWTLRCHRILGLLSVIFTIMTDIIVWAICAIRMRPHLAL
mgnify:FL=1